MITLRPLVYSLHHHWMSLVLGSRWILLGG